MSEIGLKFHCNWILEEPLDMKFLAELNLWRDKLYNSGLIGVYPDGLGYGNISIRHQQSHFIITGTSTGQLKKLSPEHYTIVTEYDLSKNSLTTVGPIRASSESLTHAVIYRCYNNANAVIHIHHLSLWRKLINKVPTTDKSVEYGTTAMAGEIIRLFKETNLYKRKLLVMAGHEEGIVSFGENLDEAGEIILNELRLLRK